jgi:hypothetical protein
VKDLFGQPVHQPGPVNGRRQRQPYSQYMTPEWAASELVERFFPSLSADDFVLEPTCGRGAFLKAIPDEVPAVGVELDPALAAVATHQHRPPDHRG